MGDDAVLQHEVEPVRDAHVIDRDSLRQLQPFRPDDGMTAAELLACLDVGCLYIVAVGVQNQMGAGAAEHGAVREGDLSQLIHIFLNADVPGDGVDDFVGFLVIGLRTNIYCSPPTISTAALYASV